jgi:hypothetical protein
MSTPILATKLYVPLPLPNVDLRPRLIERLNEGLHRRLTLLCAPAGFGKCTLLSEWLAAQPRAAAWLSLEEGDNDRTRFLAYLLAALQGGVPRGVRCRHWGECTHPIYTLCAESPCLAFSEQHAAGDRPMLWLIAVAGDAAHGVLMFPVLKQRSERIAVGYLGFRIVDAVFIAIMVLFILVQIPLGSEYTKAGPSDTSYLQALSTVFMQAQLYAYDLGMIALGIAGLILCYTLYRAKLVPRLVAVWASLDTRSFLAGWCRKSWDPDWVWSLRFQAACGRCS